MGVLRRGAVRVASECVTQYREFIQKQGLSLPYAACGGAFRPKSEKNRPQQLLKWRKAVEQFPESKACAQYNAIYSCVWAPRTRDYPHEPGSCSVSSALYQRRLLCGAGNALHWRQARGRQYSGRCRGLLLRLQLPLMTSAWAPIQSPRCRLFSRQCCRSMPGS